MDSVIFKKIKEMGDKGIIKNHKREVSRERQNFKRDRKVLIKRDRESQREVQSFNGNGESARERNKVKRGKSFDRDTENAREMEKKKEQSFIVLKQRDFS